MEITSLKNPKVIFWSKLKHKKYRDENNLFIVESPHLVKEALKKEIVIEIITLNDENYDIPTFKVTYDIMKKISNLSSPSNIMAVCKFFPPNDIIGNKILVLDKIQDPGNLGTIIRSCVAFKVQTLIISDDTVDIYNDKVIRSSEGMIFNINIIRSNLLDILPKLKTLGYKIYGTDVVGGTNVKDVNEEKCIVVIGSEGQGMSEKVKNMCDGFIYINMSDKCESLNAAVAGSIIMYDMFGR